jgi:hypothetical protein
MELELQAAGYMSHQQQACAALEYDVKCSIKITAVKRFNSQ